MKARPFRIAPGEVVGIVGTARRCRVVEADGSRRVMVRDLDRGGAAELVDTIQLTHAPTPENGAVPDPSSRKDCELGDIPEKVWAIAKERLEAIRPLLQWRRPPKQLVMERAREVGRHWTRLYAYLRDYREGGQTLDSLLPGEPSVPKGTTKLPAEIEQAMKDCIEFHYLTKQKLRVSAVDRKLTIMCKEKGFPKPHANTLRRRIARLVPHKANSRRHGPEAGAKDLPQTGGLVARYPLEIVQVDHTLCNVILVDAESGSVMGRPWITVAIDVFSRMIVGYYIAFETPGALGTGMCLSHAILPKEHWMDERGLRLKNGTMAEWPAYGLPVTLHMDNAREFRGEMIRRACEQYGIDIHFRPVKRPKFGAHVESLMDKLSQEFATLPGATFSNPQERGKAYDSEKEAAMTFQDFDRWLATHIGCVYHYRTHSGIGTSPIKRWEQGLFEGTELALPVGKLPDRFLGEDAERLQKDFLPFEWRTVRDSGVVIDKIHYWADVLRPWINARDPDNPKRKLHFIFRRNPNNIRAIWFLNPKLERYEPVPYRDTGRPPMTLWELRAARKILRDQGRKDEEINEPMIFQALAQNDATVAAAVESKKKIKAKGKFKPGLYDRSPRITASAPQAEGEDDGPSLHSADIQLSEDVDFG